MAHAKQVAAVRQLWPLLAVDEIDRSIDFYQNTLGFAVVGRAEGTDFASKGLFNIPLAELRRRHEGWLPDWIQG